jgi:nitroreductase
MKISRAIDKTAVFVTEGGAPRLARHGTSMNETLLLMARRRSVAVNAMTGPGPDAGELQTLLTLALRTPDHGKLKPWRLIVFQGEARERAGAVLAELFLQDSPDAAPERAAFERNRLARAPLVVGVVSRAAPHVKIPEWEQELSAGAVCMNLSLAAYALGYAANWMTEWYAYDRRFLSRLGLAEHEKMAGFIHIGRAAPAEDRPRPDLAEVVSYFA